MADRLGDGCDAVARLLVAVGWEGPWTYPQTSRHRRSPNGPRPGRPGGRAAGDRALVVRLTAACDPSGAVGGPSATTGVRHSQRTESGAGGGFSATWYDQFPGGCVTSRLHLTTDPNGEFAAQAPQVLGFTTRAALQQALSQRSDGRLQLDPGEAR